MKTSIMTVGNHSYIAIKQHGDPADMVTEILNLLTRFESQHPELIVESWTIEKQQLAHTTSAFIFGLWVNHRPRTESTGPEKRSP